MPWAVVVAALAATVGTIGTAAPSSDAAAFGGSASTRGAGQLGVPPAPDRSAASAARAEQAALANSVNRLHAQLKTAVDKVDALAPLPTRAAPEARPLPAVRRARVAITRTAPRPLRPSVVPGTTAPNLSAALAAGGDTFADYAYRTIYTPISGSPVTRYTEAVLGESTPINVTGSGGTQFTSKITPSTATPASLAGLTLSIDSTGAIPASDKVSIEAVLVLPSNYYLGIGEDGSSAGTATSWSATVAAGISWSSTAATVGLDVSATSPPASLATLGEVFSGTDPDTPSGDSRGDISLAPVPASSTTSITLSPSEIEAQITSSSATPSAVSADVTSRSGTKDADFSADIDDLTSDASLAYDTTGGEQDLSYSGVGTTSTLDASYTATVSGTVTQASVVDATGVPPKITLAQHGTDLAVTTPSLGAIRSIEARFGDGTNVPASPSGTGAYLSYDQSATTETAGARLDNLESLTLDAGQPYAMNMQMSAALSWLAISTSDATTGITATGTMSALPEHTSLSADLTASAPPMDTLEFDGYGSPIGQFKLDATRSPSFFGQVNTIDATLSAIPAAENFGFEESEASIGATASAPIGNVSLLMSSGMPAPIINGPDLDFVDTDGHFLGYVDLVGFESVSYSGTASSPLAGSADVGAPQDLSLGASTPYGSFSGSIDQLPNTASFALTISPLGDQVVTVSDSSPVAQIEITGSAVKLPVPAHNVAIKLMGVPTTLTLSLPGPGQGFSFGAAAVVNLVEAQAWQSGPEMNTTPDTLFYDNRLGEYRAAVMIEGLYALSFKPATTTTPLTASIKTQTASPVPLTTTVLLDGQTNAYAAIACPSTTQCTASLGGGQLLTFDPLKPSAHTAMIQLASGVAPTAIACPSATQCTAIVPERSAVSVGAISDVTNVVGIGAEVTFNPTSSSAPTPVVIDPNQTLSALSCPSTSVCVAADANEDAVSFDPTKAAKTTQTDKADNGRFGATTGLACPSSAQCTAITDFSVPAFPAGYQEYPFDPTTNFAPLGAGDQVIVANRAMSEVACSIVNQCTIVDADGKEYTFPPLSNPLDIDGGRPRSSVPTVLAASTAFTCPSSSQCSVLAGGREESFNPVSGTVVGTYVIDPTGTMLSVSCPSTTQCTGMDEGGHELTFNPHKPVTTSGNGVKGLLSQALIGSKWEITSTITDLPAVASFTLTSGSGGAFSAVYSGSTPIASLTANAFGLPVSQYATSVHIDVKAVPTGFNLTIPSSGGEISFDPCTSPTNCDSVVGSLLAEVFGGVPAPLPHAANQALVYDKVTSEATVSLQQIGAFNMTESASPLALSYNIASIPLDVDLTLGQLLNPDPVTATNPAAIASYLDSEITSPAPYTRIGLSTSNASANGVFLNYSAAAAISEIQLVTNLGHSYFSGVLEDLPQNLTVCANTTTDQGVSSPCNLYCPAADLTGPMGWADSVCQSEPVPIGWLPERTGPPAGGWSCYGFGTETAPCPGSPGGYEIYQHDDAWLQILPTDGTGSPPSTPMNVDVLACPGATEYECQSDSPVNGVAGAYPAVLSISGLKFSTVELGVGSGSTGGENYGWATLNTDPTLGVHVDQVAMWAAGEPETSSPMVLIDNTNNGAGGFIASRFSLFGEQDGSEVKAFWNGGFSCVNPLNLYVGGFSQDLAPLIGC